VNLARSLPVLFGRTDDLIEPEDGTDSSFAPSVRAFWEETFGSTLTPATAERVWAANRCNQLNAQQIASMPLVFGSNAPTGGRVPAWLSNPDPVFFPNGISDALFAAVQSIYGHGYTMLHVTSRYADGAPSGWTVVDPNVAEVKIGTDGRRQYRISNQPVPARDVVQIDRDPGNRAHGTSALRSYALSAWGLIEGMEQNREVMRGGVPTVALKSKRPIAPKQAEKIQSRWAERTRERRGRPPVLPPELDVEKLSFSPADLLLLEGLEFNARVIAAAFGVPPFLLNLPLTGGLTYQNPAMMGEYWWRFELRPMAKRIADAFTAQMLPAGNWVYFDAADTFLPLDASSEKDDPQAAESSTAATSPATAVTPIRRATGS
jgi:HK97 family phage portal protein